MVCACRQANALTIIPATNNGTPNALIANACFTGSRMKRYINGTWA